jgi:hypothetical protein
MSDQVTEQDREDHLADVYLGVCKSADVEVAVGGLHNETLRELHGWLCRLNVESGIPGLIRGLVVLECCNRFLERK